MSFDPFGQQPSPSGQPTPGGSPPPPLAPLITHPVSVVPPQERVVMPGVLLVALGVLNVLLALVQTGFFLAILLFPAEDYQRFMVNWFTKLADLYESEEGKEFAMKNAEQIEQTDPEKHKWQSVLNNGLTSLLMLAISLLGLAGGVAMLRLRGYGLAMTGALVTAVPCLSLSGCCCGLGQILSVWCVIVLLNPLVRTAFR